MRIFVSTTNGQKKVEDMPFVDDMLEEVDVNEEGHEVENENSQEVDEDLTFTEEQHGVFLDTCLQPVDIAQEILDQHFDSVLSVAPAEGNSPVHSLVDKSNEAKCFPSLYPTGGPVYHDERPVRITRSSYFKNRILNADGRFARNTDYLFYSQYISEIDQILSSVSIALRKGSSEGLNRPVSASMLTNKETLKEILHFDEG